MLEDGMLEDLGVKTKKKNITWKHIEINVLIKLLKTNDDYDIWIWFYLVRWWKLLFHINMF